MLRFLVACHVDGKALHTEDDVDGEQHMRRGEEGREGGGMGRGKGREGGGERDVDCCDSSVGQCDTQSTMRSVPF